MDLCRGFINPKLGPRPCVSGGCGFCESASSEKATPDGMAFLWDDPYEQRMIGLLQSVPEERRQFFERDQIEPIIAVHMAGARNHQQLLGLARELVGLLAEFPGVGVFADDEEHRPGRNRLDIGKWIETHELDVAGQRRVRGEFGRLTFGVYSSRGVGLINYLAGSLLLLCWLHNVIRSCWREVPHLELRVRHWVVGSVARSLLAYLLRHADLASLSPMVWGRGGATAAYAGEMYTQVQRSAPANTGDSGAFCASADRSADSVEVSRGGLSMLGHARCKP